MNTLYYHNFNFLKIIFTLIVVLYHFVRFMGFWNQGGYAVELFFIISGFLCATTFDKNISALEFSKKRIFSFMPLLILAVLTLMPNYIISIKQILNNILLNPFFGKNLFALHAWYITVWFWISLGLFCLAKTFQKKHLLLIISLLTCYSIITMISHDKWIGWQKINGIDTGYLRGMAGMGIGYLLSYTVPQLTINKHTKKTNLYLLKKIFFTCLECFFLFYTIFSMFIQKLFISPYVILVSSAILIYLFTQQKGWLSTFTNQPSFSKIKNFILPIYLLQMSPISIFYTIYFDNKNLLDQYPLLTICITLILVCIYGISGYYFLKYLSNLWKRVVSIKKKSS